MDPKKEARKARRRARREQGKQDRVDRIGAVRRAEAKITPVTHFKLPDSYTERAKIYEVGECICVVDMHDAVGWSITMSHKSRAPTLEEFWAARRHLVPPGIQMAILIGPSAIRTGMDGTGLTAQEGRLFAYAVQVDLPRLIEFKPSPSAELPSEAAAPPLPSTLAEDA